MHVHVCCNLCKIYKNKILKDLFVYAIENTQVQMVASRKNERPGHRGERERVFTIYCLLPCS